MAIKVIGYSAQEILSLIKFFNLLLNYVAYTLSPYTY